MAARTAVVAGTATAVSGRVQRRQQEKYADQSQQQADEAAQQQAAMDQAAAEAVANAQAAQASAAPPPAAGDDVIARLDQLAQLHTRGVLSDDEFTAAKAKLLS
ncbi:SHOCT domain-containing protein [Microbacterium sp. SLBN-154]|uniref:SHOCT domain-containing protein n=1 Tax=Microbacterium sp. SLBN-154 TaxID=2768458 RepID=UPI001F34A4F8|nr:SHOCT domain-containing protein [Microbacterium sp. SLBN-154]